MAQSGPHFETDIVVVGSGAAGLSAALAARHCGADVLVLERSDKYGGTTAVSGGVAWIPNNHCMADRGVADSPDQALAYLRALSLGKMDEDLIQTFVAEAPRVLRFIEDNSALRFKAVKVLDYHAEFEGGTIRRSVCADLFPAGDLGEYRSLLRASPHFPIPFIATDPEEGINPLDPEVIGDRLSKDMVGMGAALIAGLLKAALDKGVRFEHSVRARRLIRESGCIVGLEAERAGARIMVRARRAVILASGGFEWNEDLVRQFLRGPRERAQTPPQNTGDGLLMAMDVGAALGNMCEAWWHPTVSIPGEEYDNQSLSRVTGGERSLPGSIMVNREGRRFANEAVNYNDLGRVFHTFDPVRFDYPNLPAWIILHQGFLDRYPFASYFPGDPIPQWLVQAPRLDELAEKIGVDPAGLEQTVERFNRHAREGTDPDFGRGETTKEQSWGDPSRIGPACVLGPLDQPPFYACRVYAGTIGTKGGPRTNALAQVLDTRGEPIAGLYAAGNCSASVMGIAYPGGGATIGPALTFGHIAGRVAAGQIEGTAHRRPSSGPASR